MQRKVCLNHPNVITKENKTIKLVQKKQTFAHTYPDFIDQIMFHDFISEKR